MTDPYSLVIADFAKYRIRASLKPNGQLLLPIRIWITWKEYWFISTWLPAVYQVPNEIEINTLCRDCLEADDGGAWYTIPERIIQKYRLQRLDDEVVDGLLPPAEDEVDDE